MFQDQTDFNLGSVTEVFDNCETAAVFNDKRLFVGYLKRPNQHRIVTVGGSNYKPTHIGSGEVSVRDNYVSIVTIPIPRVLDFPASPVNVLSTCQMSLQYGNRI